MTTINEVIKPFINTANELTVDWDAVQERLLAREDNMRDVLHLAGIQFGLYPFIVAEVLAEAGLGTPPTPEEREMIRANFVAGMENLRREFEQGQEGV